MYIFVPLSFLCLLPSPFFRFSIATRAWSIKLTKAVWRKLERKPSSFFSSDVRFGAEKGRTESAKIAEHENRGGNAENRLGRLQSRWRWEKLLQTIREHLSLSLSRRRSCDYHKNIRVKNITYMISCLLLIFSENAFISLEDWFENTIEFGIITTLTLQITRFCSFLKLLYVSSVTNYQCSIINCASTECIDKSNLRFENTICMNPRKDKHVS